MNQDKYELKVVKQVNYLPDVFMIRHMNNSVTKISTISGSFIDCKNYVSRSGKTFGGCLKLQNGELKEVRGIYYLSIDSIFGVSSRQKISQDLEYMKKYIMAFIWTSNLQNQELLISYDNYSFYIYDKFVKGKLVEFPLYFIQGHLEIYSIPSLKTTVDLNVENGTVLKIYNHEIEFSNEVEIISIYSNPGSSYIIHPVKDTDVKIQSIDHGTNTIVIHSGKYYLFTHPSSRSTKTD